LRRKDRRLSTHPDGLLLEVHDGGEDLVDRVENEHVEGSVELGSILSGSLGGPLLGLGVEVVWKRRR